MIRLQAMVRISKNALPETTERKLIQQLGALIISQQNPRESEKFLFELFTPTERTVFIKRIGIIAMLQQEYSPYSISGILKVSETTVAKIVNGLERGKFSHISTTLQRKEHRESISGIIESLVTFGMPGNPQKLLRKKIKKDIEAWKAGSK